MNGKSFLSPLKEKKKRRRTTSDARARIKTDSRGELKAEAREILNEVVIRRRQGGGGTVTREKKPGTNRRAHDRSRARQRRAKQQLKASRAGFAGI